LATEFEQQSSGELFDKLYKEDKKYLQIYIRIKALRAKGNRKNSFSTDARNELSKGRAAPSARTLLFAVNVIIVDIYIYIYIYIYMPTFKNESTNSLTSVRYIHGNDLCAMRHASHFAYN